MKNSEDGITSSLSRRTFLRSAVGTVGAAALANSSGNATTSLASNTEAKRPNLVFFLGEGVRADEFSSTGNKIISTPHLDRIVREGASFRNAFVVNSLCAPSRATILTGLYSCRSGVPANDGRIPDSIPTIADMLRQAGYEVAFFGKSHITDSAKRNWDAYFGFEGAEANMYHPVLTESKNGTVIPPQKYEGYCDDLVTDRALEWLDQKHDKPFCLFLWFLAPHEPFYRARRYADLYNGIKIPKPETFDDDLKGYPGKPRAFTKGLNRMVTGIYEGNFEDAARSLEEIVKDHYAGVVDNDDNAGRVMDALEKAGILDETAIILTSDHGFFLGEWCLYNKMLMHEPSIRVPLAVRYPRLIPPGTVSEQMALNLDIAPTILELAGLEIPASMQGHSLVPLMKGDHSTHWRQDWLYAYYDGQYASKNRGIRTDRYKLIEYWEADPAEYELYDLQEDPAEVHNLYGDPRYSDLTKQLLRRMKELRNETGEI